MDMEIDTPIRQVVRGQTGCYSQFNEVCVCVSNF